MQNQLQTSAKPGSSTSQTGKGSAVHTAAKDAKEDNKEQHETDSQVDQSLKKDTEMTVKAGEQLDWFKFETRIRKIILELTEPGIKRGRELEQESRTQKLLFEKVQRRLDETEHLLEKLQKKTAVQDDIFNQLRQIDSFTKITETKVLNEINNMNGNLDLVKEKMRVDQSEVEDHIRTIQKQGDALTRIHEQIIALKTSMSTQLQAETKDLKAEILAVKQYFDEQKDYVTQFDSTIAFLKKQSKTQKKAIEDNHLALQKELETYRLNILRADKSYDTCTESISHVFEQIMDIEQRLIQSFKKDLDKQQAVEAKLKEIERYLKVVQPMNGFGMVTETLHKCLRGRELNACVEHAEQMWPGLQLRLERFGIEGSEVPQLDLQNVGEIPALPERVDEAEGSLTAEQANEVHYILEERLAVLENINQQSINTNTKKQPGQGQGMSAYNDVDGEEDPPKATQNKRKPPLETSNTVSSRQSRMGLPKAKPAKVEQPKQPEAADEASDLHQSVAAGQLQAKASDTQSRARGQPSTQASRKSQISKDKGSKPAERPQALYSNESMRRPDRRATNQKQAANIDNSNNQLHELKQEQKSNQNRSENNHGNEQVDPDTRGSGPEADREEQNVTAKLPSDRQQPFKKEEFNNSRQIEVELEDVGTQSKGEEQVHSGGKQASNKSKTAIQTSKSQFKQKEVRETARMAEEQKSIKMTSTREPAEDNDQNSFKSDCKAASGTNGNHVAEQEARVKASSSVDGRAIDEREEQREQRAKEEVGSEGLQSTIRRRQSRLKPANERQEASREASRQHDEGSSDHRSADVKLQETLHTEEDFQMVADDVKIESAASQHSISAADGQQKALDFTAANKNLGSKASLKDQAVDPSYGKANDTKHQPRLRAAPRKPPSTYSGGRPSLPGPESAKGGQANSGLSEEGIRAIIWECLGEFREEEADFIDEQVQQALQAIDPNISTADHGTKGVQHQLDSLADRISELQQDQGQTNERLAEGGSLLDIENGLKTQLDSKVQDFIKEQTQSLSSFRDMVETELRKRTRKENDFTLQREKLAGQVDEFRSELDNVLNKIAITAQSISCLREVVKIQTAINLQEEIDKQSVALYGLRNGAENEKGNDGIEKNTSQSPNRSKIQSFGRSVFGGGGFEKTDEKQVISLNKMCASCSGQNQHIVKLFKLACIQYNSQKVPYQGKEIDREKIIYIQNQLCQLVEKKMNEDRGLMHLLQSQQLESNFKMDTIVMMSQDKIGGDRAHNEDLAMLQKARNTFSQGGLDASKGTVVQNQFTNHNYFINTASQPLDAPDHNSSQFFNSAKLANQNTITSDMEGADPMVSRQVHLSAAARALKLTNSDEEKDFKSFMRNDAADQNQVRLKHIRSKVVQVYGANGAKTTSKQITIPKHKIEIEAIIETEKQMGSKMQSSITSAEPRDKDVEKFFERPKTMHNFYSEQRMDRPGPNINVLGSQTKLLDKHKANQAHSDARLPSLNTYSNRPVHSQGKELGKRVSSTGLMR